MPSKTATRKTTRTNTPAKTTTTSKTTRTRKSRKSTSTEKKASPSKTSAKQTTPVVNNESATKALVILLARQKSYSNLKKVPDGTESDN